ncbi:MAG TPA: hypothetical protein VLL48_05950 [Longimicrobiales bacterium]|nr:hypothetical protein [Longimicrobiales bacterium]
MIGWLFGVGAVLVVAAWIGSRRRLKRMGDSGLSDGDIRRIEASGRVERDEPLDLEEAAEEEERFWGETWDEPEPL